MNKAFKSNVRLLNKARCCSVFDEVIRYYQELDSDLNKLVSDIFEGTNSTIHKTFLKLCETDSANLNRSVYIKESNHGN